LQHTSRLSSPDSAKRTKPADQQQRIGAAWWLILIACLLLGAFTLRIWSINKESFWADEGWSMLIANGPTLGTVVGNTVNDQHPPLYFAILHYWTMAVGDSELTSRMLSTLWSLLGVALAYRLSTDVFRSRGAGLLGALILGLADNDIMMAQETRHYTQMTALALLSSVYYFRYVRSGRRGAGLGWFGASVALMYTHYLGAFVLLIQGLHALILVRPIRKKLDLIVRLALVGAAWLPWLFVFLNQSAVRYTRPIIYRNSIPNTPETFITLRGDLLGGQFALMFGLLLLGLAYVRYLDGLPLIRWRPALPTAYLAAWVFVPTLVIVAINSRLEILTPRNFLLITPPIAILIGHGLMNLDRTARAFVIAVMVFYGLTTVDSYFVKPPWRQVALDVLRYRRDGEPVIMDVWVDDFALRYHLGRDLHTPPADLPLISIPEWLEKYTTGFHARLLDYVNHYDSVWLVQWSKDEAGLVGLLESHGFRRTAEQIETHLTTNIIHIWRYDRPPSGAAALATFSAPAPQGAATPILALARTAFDSTVMPGGSLPVALWWSVLAPPGKDYSTSVFLLAGDGRLAAQQDGPPLGGKAPMSAWLAGEYRFDQPTIAIPTGLAPGAYTLGLKVYFYAEPRPLLVQSGAGGAAPNNGEYVILGTVQIS
jgi:hypothetical protein